MHPNPEIYQMEEAIATFGDERIVREALKSHREMTAVVEQITTAYKQGDNEGFRKGVHWLRGGLSYLHARPLKDVFMDLERLSQLEPQPDLSEALARVRVEMERLNRCLDAYLSQES